MDGVELATAYVSIVPSTAGLAPAVARDFGAIEAVAAKTGKSTGKTLGGGMLGALKGFAGPLAAAAGVASVVGFMGDAMDEAREAQKVGALTEQIIKSTGGAAKVSAADVSTLAESISRKAGIDDEAIQTGANLLLTFKNVRNEVGLGNDIFNQATQAAVDLSAAGFGSVDSASKMLGKALNDPLKGLSALGRAGVTFSEDQKKLIKGFVAQGDTLSAQKIIMKEVQSQVGGAAAASATAGDKLSVTWGNFKEQIGTAVLPVIDGLFNVLNKGITWMMDNVGPAFDKVKTWVTNAIRPLLPTFREIWTAIQQIVQTAMVLVRAVVELVLSRIRTFWENWGAAIMKHVRVVFEVVLGIIRPALKFVQSTIQFVLAVIRGDWSGAWNAMKNMFKAVWDTIKAVVTGALKILGSAISTAWEGIKKTAGGIWGAIVKIVGEKWNGLVDAIQGPVRTVLRWIQVNLIDKVNSLMRTLFGKGAWQLPMIFNTRDYGTGNKPPSKTYGRFWSGGYTGAGGTYEPRGVVHGGEWVVPKAATSKIVRDMGWGYLQALNQYAAGGYVWPTKGQPSFPWGRYPSGGIHRAYDIPGALGQPVWAPAAGTVIRDGWDSTGYGYHVRIQHAQALGASILGHMTREVVRVGQQLAQGQLVGYLGSTGRSTGPHVHWATRWNPYSDSTAFDPMRKGVAGGGNFITNFIADRIKDGIKALVGVATSTLNNMGPFGRMASGIASWLGKGFAAKAMALLGLDSGGTMKPALYDSGGVLHPGQWGFNATGRSELVVPHDAPIRLHADDMAAIASLIASGAATGIERGMTGRVRIERREARQREGIT